MARFNARSATHQKDFYGAPYGGHENRPLNQHEEVLREMLRARTMSTTRAKKIYQDFDVSRPYHSRIEFIEALAALTALFGDEVV